MEVKKHTLTAKQAAHYLGVSYWTILGMARQGQIKHFKGGNKILFRQQSLDEWISDAEELSVRQSE